MSKTGRPQYVSRISLYSFFQFHGCRYIISCVRFQKIITNLPVPPNGHFFRAANSIFAKVGRLASKVVTVQLLKQKCLPILLYGLDVYDKSSMHSLNFTVNRLFKEVLWDINMEIVKCCQVCFGVNYPVCCWSNATINLLTLWHTLVKFYLFKYGNCFYFCFATIYGEYITSLLRILYIVRIL